MTLQGSCLCGVVRYELDQLDTPIAHCHCVTCRKAHAAAYVSTAGVMRGHFRCTAGTERLATSELSPGMSGTAERKPGGRMAASCLCLLQTCRSRYHPLRSSAGGGV
jgi:hypothetical protein